MSNASYNTIGIGFVGLLGVAFIVLKLCDIIDWSWEWVLTPIWMSIVAVLFLYIVLAIVSVIIAFTLKRHH